MKNTTSVYADTKTKYGNLYVAIVQKPRQSGYIGGNQEPNSRPVR